MKLFAGNPFNLMEFNDFDFILSTHPWSLKDQRCVVCLINNNTFHIYNNDKVTVLDENKRILKINYYNICFGNINDVINYEFYFFSLIKKTDLIILNLKISSYSNLYKLYDNIKANSNLVNIPVLLVENIQDKNHMSYYAPNSNEEFLFKSASYVYFDTENYMNNKKYIIGKYYKELSNTLKTFKHTVKAND